MRPHVFLIVLACLAACGPTETPALTLHDRNRAELDRIADICGLPRKTFQLLGDDHVQMQPVADANYRNVDCAIAELKRKTALKLGFVGNEHYVGNGQ